MFQKKAKSDDKTVDMMDFSANSNVTAIFHTFSTPVVWNEADSKEEKAKCKKICIYDKNTTESGISYGIYLLIEI